MDDLKLVLIWIPLFPQTNKNVKIRRQKKCDIVVPCFLFIVMIAKFTGSGGAIVCIRDFGTGQGHRPVQCFEFAPEEEKMIRDSFAARRFQFVRVKKQEQEMQA